MSIPDGYTTAPVSTDHLCKLAVPVPGREPILIEAPRLAWMPPDEVDAYDDWAKRLVEDEKEVDAWEANNAAWGFYEPDPEAWAARNDALPEEDRVPVPTKPGPYPAKKAKSCGRSDPEKLKQNLREFKIRWIKPYLGDDDYNELVTSRKLPERTITWIFDQLNKQDVDPVTVGEFGASADS